MELHMGAWWSGGASGSSLLMGSFFVPSRPAQLKQLYAG